MRILNLSTKKKKKKPKLNLVPAIPPDDYKGSTGKWMEELQERKLWDGNGWHGDIKIPANVWWEILEKLEK